MKMMPLKEVLLALWGVSCVFMYVFDLCSGYPEVMRSFFTASYLQ